MTRLTHKQVLAVLKSAAAENDRKTWLRVYVENRVSITIATQMWREGRALAAFVAARDSAYKITKDGTNSEKYPAGTICYLLKQYDYGLAKDDTRATGIEHVSVTLKSDGDYPSFTIPRSDLELT